MSSAAVICRRKSSRTLTGSEITALRIGKGRVHKESNKRSRESLKCRRVLSMPQSFIELQ
jgi:hypothetical protein